MGHICQESPAQENAAAQFERQLVHAYLAGAGHDAQALVARNDDEARRLLADASQYAHEQSSEIHVRRRHLWAAHPELTSHLYE